MREHSPTDQQSTLLQIEVSGDGIRQDVVLRGELDLSTADYLRDVLRESTAMGARFIVVHMAALDFLSVAGLNVFVNAHASLSLSGGRLVLVQPNRCALRLLQVLQLDELLTVTDDPACPVTHNSDNSDQVEPYQRRARWFRNEVTVMNRA